jgi:signal transduction histidine kinase/ActR/RegA family two-component response regulator
VSIRQRLLRLMVLMLLPTTAVSVVAAWSVYTEERSAIVAAATGTAKALSLVVDRELDERASVLRTLASSEALVHGDLAAFHRQAKAALTPGDPSVIVLLETDGQQLLNTGVPFGAPGLPKTAARVDFEQLRQRPFVVSNLFVARLQRQHHFAVQLPVHVDGMAPLLLGMGSPASQLQSVFREQPLPPGWVGSLLDASGHVVARSVNDEALRGRLATPDALEAISKGMTGSWDNTTLDGRRVVAVFSRSATSGWTVLVGMPRQALEGPAWRAFAAVMSVGLLLTGLAMLAALRLARGIARPVRQLSDDARQLGRGQLVEPTVSGLEEIDAVQRALVEASRERLQADERLQARVSEAVADAHRAQEAAMRAQKLEALGRLTGGIAHDFNNLLQTMTTGLQLSYRLAPDERAKNALLGCERAVSKAVKLTRQLMTFGSLQPGHSAVIDLWHELPATQEMISGAVRDTIRVELHLAPDLWPVRVDRVQLELALLNLALNARDAIEREGTIDIHADNVEHTLPDGTSLARGDYVRLAMRDSGCGMPPEVLARVFEPFYTTKPVGKGSGLGLAQVYGFATHSGGAVTARSEPGHGTEIVIWLPRCHEEPSHTQPSPLQQESPRYRGNLLLVEDDSLLRGVTAQAFEAMGFHVTVASNADDALAIVRSRLDIDVVLSDIVMPGGRSGLDLARTLQVLRPALPVVLASGYSDALAQQELGFPVVAKPYDVHAIGRQLFELVHGARNTTPSPLAD